MGHVAILTGGDTQLRAQASYISSDLSGGPLDEYYLLTYLRTPGVLAGHTHRVKRKGLDATLVLGPKFQGQG